MIHAWFNGKEGKWEMGGYGFETHNNNFSNPK
jgi:hypothetical protein